MARELLVVQTGCESKQPRRSALTSALTSTNSEVHVADGIAEMHCSVLLTYEVQYHCSTVPRKSPLQESHSPCNVRETLYSRDQAQLRTTGRRTSRKYRLVPSARNATANQRNRPYHPCELLLKNNLLHKCRQTDPMTDPQLGGCAFSSEDNSQFKPLLARRARARSTRLRAYSCVYAFLLESITATSRLDPPTPFLQICSGYGRALR